MYVYEEAALTCKAVIKALDLQSGGIGDQVPP